jgi:hypothetical protein
MWTCMLTGASESSPFMKTSTSSAGTTVVHAPSDRLPHSRSILTSVIFWRLAAKNPVMCGGTNALGQEIIAPRQVHPLCFWQLETSFRGKRVSSLSVDDEHPVLLISMPQDLHRLPHQVRFDEAIDSFALLISSSSETKVSA